MPYNHNHDFCDICFPTCPGYNGLDWEPFDTLLCDYMTGKIERDLFYFTPKELREKVIRFWHLLKPKTKEMWLDFKDKFGRNPKEEDVRAYLESEKKLLKFNEDIKKLLNAKLNKEKKDIEMS